MSRHHPPTQPSNTGECPIMHEHHIPSPDALAALAAAEAANTELDRRWDFSFTSGINIAEVPTHHSTSKG